MRSTNQPDGPIATGIARHEKGIAMFLRCLLSFLILGAVSLVTPIRILAAPLLPGPVITYDFSYSGSGPDFNTLGTGYLTVSFMNEAGQTVSGSATGFGLSLAFTGTTAPVAVSTFSYGLADLNSDVVVADGTASNPILEYFEADSNDQPAQFTLAFPSQDTSTTYPSPYLTSGSVTLVPESSTLGLTAGAGFLLVIAGLLRRKSAFVAPASCLIQPKWNLLTANTSRLSLLGVFALAALLVPIARADSVTYSSSFGLDNNGMPIYAPYMQLITLPLFNTTLGQLTGIQLSFNGDLSFSNQPNNFNSGGIVTNIPSIEIFGTAAITYTYTPFITTPEPQATALNFIGLSFAVYLLKRRDLSALNPAQPHKD
jgi:hypothetical protein